MALKDIVAEERVVMFGSNEVAVRGLSFGDVTAILMEHGEEVVKMISEAQAAGTDQDQDQMVSAGMNYLLGEADVLLAKLIARAAGEPDSWPNVRNISAPKQLELLIAVFELTFTEPESLGNFIRGLTNLMSRVGQQAGQTGRLKA